MTQAIPIHVPLHELPQPVEVHLDAGGALFWPEGSTLFIADPHFGKTATFHAAGIAIPSKLLEHDLARLGALVQRHAARRLIILGDFFHTKESQSQGVLDQLAAWRARHADLDVGLVPGNHDTHAGAPPTSLAITPLAPGTALGPFSLAHEPDASPAAHSGYRLAGHLHPSVTLHGPGGVTSSERCFVVGPHQAILPAFGSFTGSSRYRPSASDRIFVVGEGQIVEITRRKSPRRT